MEEVAHGTEKCGGHGEVDQSADIPVRADDVSLHKILSLVWWKAG
jgi:hypothetical protein